MSDGSTIEWTDATWNPVRGCVKISPGCKHCYAETFAERFRGVENHPYQEGFEPMLIETKLTDPLRWPGSRLVFVNSMSDLFLELVPDNYIAEVAKVMLATPWHTYQVLTKRAARQRRLLEAALRDAANAEHIWWGVSVEDQKYGLPRVHELQQAPAKVRFLSVEPLLEDLGELPLAGIHWVIVGGESGPGAREMKPEWVTSIRDQCEAAKVPFFFKQWGGVLKKKKGRKLGDRTYDDMPPRSSVNIRPRTERLRLAAEIDRRIAERDFVMLSPPRLASERNAM
jgi:protein gp37